MSSKEFKRTELDLIISKLYRETNPDVVENDDYLNQLQRNCVQQANPYVCFFTLLLGEKPKIIWSHNTGRHFGLVDIKYEDVFRLVHPSWLFAYTNYARAMYEIAYARPELANSKGAAAGSVVPLLHQSGKYYWYHQISVRAANDGDKLAAHLNYYHQSTIYTGQLPTMPTLITAGEQNKVYTAELNRLALEFIPGFLEEFLSKSQVKFMLQHRQVVAAAGDKKPTRHQLLAQIPGVESLDNLNKIRQRIRKKVQARFKHPALDSVYGLSKMLNRYFPLID